MNRSNFTQVTPDGRVVAGPTDGAGTWETFRIFNQTDPDGELKYGDVVLIQAHTGRFLALGGGSNPLNPSVSSTATRREEALHFIVDALSAASMGRPVGTSHFRLRKAAMPDAFAPDRISPEAFYLSFDSIGAILARTTAAAAVVRLQSMDGEIVQVRRGRSGPTMTAEGGGGRELTANRLEVGLWESFKLLNLSRPRQRPQVGDVIALQTTNGRFVGLPQPASAGAELAARIVRLTPAAHLEVVAISPDLAGLLQLALRRASASTGLFTSRGDRIVFTPEATQTALNLWTVISSRDRPTEYRFLSEGGDLPATRPFATPPARVSGRRSVVVATYNVDPLPEGVEDISWVTEEVLRPGFVGEDGFSVATWLDDNTGGAVTISWGGLISISGIQSPHFPTTTKCASQPSPTLA